MFDFPFTYNICENDKSYVYIEKRPAGAASLSEENKGTRQAARRQSSLLIPPDHTTT